MESLSQPDPPEHHPVDPVEATVEPHQHPIDALRVQHARQRLPSLDETSRLTSLLSLMSDPIRLRVLYALDVTEELCVGDLALALEANENQVGYALRLLRAAGLVMIRKEGRVVFNRLAADFPEPLRAHCLHQLVLLTDTSGESQLR